MYNLTAPLFVFKFMFLAQIAVAEMLIAYRLKKKEKFALRMIISVICILAVTFALPIPYYNAIYSSLLFVIIFSCTLLAMRFCLDEPWGTIAFCGFFSYNQQHIAFQIYSLGCKIIGMDANASTYGGNSDMMTNGLQMLVFIVSNAVVYTICWAFMAYRFSRHKGTQFNIIHMRVFVLSIVVVVINVVTYTVVAYNLPSDLPDFVNYTIIFYNVFSCVLALVMLMSVVGQEELQSELKLMEGMLRKNEQIYELSKVNVDFINMKCHDLRHRIRNARTRLNVDEGELAEIEEAIDIYDAFLKTGNEVLDVILSEESIFCNKNNIKLLCNVDGARLGFIKQADLYSIFQNGIHNAVDAVMNIAEEERRIIRLTVKQVERMISISIENYTDDGNHIEFIDGLPVSPKSDGNTHGFGMKSIRTSVEKYGGYMCAELKNGIFYLNVMISTDDSELS